ncbi:MAG: hypothetical protein AAGA66_05095 [Bacteroidota bacterium]
MKHHEQINRIDLYHSGQMSPQEQIAFEKELVADPSLKAESEFQSDIIQGLKEYRKLQLKSRLDAIDVSGGWLGVVQQSVFVKSMGGVAIASLIGAGVYFYGVSPKEPMIDEGHQVFIASTDVGVPPLQSQKAFEWDLKTSDLKSDLLNNLEQVQNRIQAFDQYVAAGDETSDSVIDKKALNEEAKEFVPTFEVPEIQEVSDLAISTPDIEETKSSEPVEEIAVSPLDIETVNTKSSKIKYKYYDGKLFLSGNFERKPYEIIEINGASGRRIYLLHNRKYFEVNITDRLTELPEVRNIRLIQELRLIKANK